MWPTRAARSTLYPTSGRLHDPGGETLELPRPGPRSPGFPGQVHRRWISWRCRNVWMNVERLVEQSLRPGRDGVEHERGLPRARHPGAPGWKVWRKSEWPRSVCRHAISRTRVTSSTSRHPGSDARARDGQLRFSYTAPNQLSGGRWTYFVPSRDRATVRDHAKTSAACSRNHSISSRGM